MSARDASRESEARLRLAATPAATSAALLAVRELSALGTWLGL